MTADPEVLVVVPCLNEAAHIGRLLTQLAADPGCAHALIVVADGGSTDETRDIVTAFAAGDQRIRLLDNPRRIQSAGVNLAVRHYGPGADFLVRIDAHCLYPDAYVEKIIATFRRTETQSVVVPMKTIGLKCFQRAVAAAQNSRLGAGNSAHRIGGQSGYIDHGHHAAWRIGAFADVGGYDEGFSHNEDAEFDARLTAAGGRIWLAADAEITYFPRASIGRLFTQYLAYGRGRARTLRRHRMAIKPRQFLPLLVFPAVIAGLAGPIFWPVAAPAALWASACLIYGVALAARVKDACVLASGVAAMTMHLAWSLGFLKERLFAPAPGPFSGQELV